MKYSKFLTGALAIVTAALLLSLAIAVPILCRPFYYAHIGPLKLQEQTGLSEDEIKTAYNEMMDYCLGGPEFSTGVLKWSEAGKSHFTDVRGLFLLNLWMLAGSAAALCVLFVTARLTRRRPARLAGRGFSFWTGAGLGGILLLVGGWASLDFGRAFVVFHTIFFPGKDNWIFHPAEDQIITILPQQFFMNCAILILGLVILGCSALIAVDFLKKRSPTP